MKAGYAVFVCLYFLGMITRAIYEKLKEKGRVSPKNRFTLAIVFLAMCLMWASWFNMCPLDPIRVPLPPVVGWIGYGIFLVGLVLAIGATIHLRGIENIENLKTKGLFSKIRHPMYLGFILWIFGWVIYHGAVLSLCLGFVAIANILYWQRSEERELESKYGQAYLQYRNTTWF
jgi:protein-S-isoprenylcysteine O-methyltransferase Ste14